MATILSTEHVRETFEFVKHELEAGDSQARDIQVNALIRSLTEFVRRMASDHTLTVEEQNLVEMEVAVGLLTTFQIRARSDVYRQILLDRSKT